VSWHTSALVIEGRHSDRAPHLLAELGFPGKTEIGVVGGDAAGSSDLRGRAIGLVGGWTVLWDPMMFVPDGLDDLEGMFDVGIWARPVESALQRLSQASRIYLFIVEGSSDTYGFAWYFRGRRRRLWLSQSGAVVFEDGARLPEELAPVAEEPDNEQRMFLLMNKLTGVSIQDADAATYRLFAYGGGCRTTRCS
jgi:hypothetical protein